MESIQFTIPVEIKNRTNGAVQITAEMEKTIRETLGQIFDEMPIKVELTEKRDFDFKANKVTLTPELYVSKGSTALGHEIKVGATRLVEPDTE